MSYPRHPRAGSERLTSVFSQWSHGLIQAIDSGRLANRDPKRIGATDDFIISELF